MARQRRNSTKPPANVSDFRYKDAKRKNIPPAKIAAEGTVPTIAKARYYYSPRLPPALRFDADGSADDLPDLLEKATREKLTADEARLLAEALRTHEPWLEWAEKREQHDRRLFEVDPVALHIHERVSAQAILKVAARQDVTRDLFADPEQEYHEAVQFYRHDVDWANRLILGDSLAVMSSLARREDLAGKVQMIYLDPPYGIKFASNFQPEVGRRDVKDKEQDLTREPEMVKAYRDTWHLGIHSYLSYLRDRLIVARELLADTGSIFVQISDENLHRVRMLLDEVFGPRNFISQIAFLKTSGATVVLLPSTADHILWYARSRDEIKFRRVFTLKSVGGAGASKYDQVDLANGYRGPVAPNHEQDGSARVFRLDNLTSQSVGREKGEGAASWFPVQLKGREFRPSMKNRWKTNEQGMRRLLAADRVSVTGDTVAYVRFIDDFPAYLIADVWMDIGGIQSRADPKVYVVQTATSAVERCMLMTSDPGDLVLDPTCGSGTTAYVAEQWGRRWITIDTSRVAIAIARQRLLTAKYDFYKLRPLAEEDRSRNPSGTWLSEPGDQRHEQRTLKCESVPHVTLKSIAQNTNLDPIFAKHKPILDKAQEGCNTALKRVPPDLHARLAAKLGKKQEKEGKKAITDADRRRWLLPPDNRKSEPRPSGSGPGGACYTVDMSVPTWYDWEVPFDPDPDWPKELQEAVSAYRKAWRAKMDEVNACIAANAEQEELVDQPEVVKGVVRVSGPFTVEAVQPPEMSLGDEAVSQVAVEEGGLFDGEPGEMQTWSTRIVEPRPDMDVTNVHAYLEDMVRLLRMDGVRFPDNKPMKFSRLEPTFDAGNPSGIHAAGRWVPVGSEDLDPDGPATVGVAFGPQYGPVTAKQVEELIKPASRRYDDLVIAGFSFDGRAQAVIEEAQHPKLRIHMANIRPDVNPGMSGLLKERPGSQLFTVFGQPRTKLEGPNADRMYTVTMEGVDIYNPVDNTVSPCRADRVAAWFLDSDYDGRTFCITQAFFPDRTAWDKLSRALNGPGGVIDEERFAALSGTVSLPFPEGKHGSVAVKVIDPRGNEVMRVERIR